MGEQLDVLLDGQKVAILEDVGLSLGASLTYTPETVAHHGNGTILLSVKLPVADETYGSVETKYFLDGLLPEADVRVALADRARVPHDDTFALLAAYGLDCAGAIQCVPTGTFDAREPSVLWLSADELEEAVVTLPAAPLGIKVSDGVRSSLGGMQGKLPLVVSGARIGVPENGAPSTHILKPARQLADGSEEWPGIVEAEAFALHVIAQAHDTGADDRNGWTLRAAAAIPFPVGKRSALLVTRFDRTESDPVRRIHQEDGAQALGTNQKYQQNTLDPPRLIDIAGLLAEHATVPVRERRSLLELTVVNAVFGNADAHARNMSLQLENGSVRLAPAYDVVPTSVWPGHSRELSLRIGGEAFVDDVEADHFLDEAEGWGYRRSVARRLLQQSLAATAEAIDVVEKRTRDDTDAWHPTLDAVVTQARERLQRYLGGL